MKNDKDPEGPSPELIENAWRHGKYRPMVAAIIKGRDGRFLFVQGANNGREWSFLQGGIARGERADVALFREIEEEVGIPKEKLTLIEFLGVEDLFAPWERKNKRGFSTGKRYFFFSLLYKGEEELKTNKKEIAAYVWELPKDAEKLLSKTRKRKKKLILEYLKKTLQVARS